jgi:signal transduction histidine kinase
LLKGRLGELTEMQMKSAKTIFDNATRLSRLIQDILDVRKMELGRLKLDIRDANAKEIIAQCITAFKTTVQSKNITLVDNSQDIALQCDPDRIIQVINNLLSNAFKFVPQENGKIELGTKIDNKSVIFSVKDNGIGIPKDKQDSLFKKFYQIDTALGRKAGGSGLGLVICKGIIESHKGKIWIESELGKGTIIYFSIPMEVI